MADSQKLLALNAAEAAYNHLLLYGGSENDKEVARTACRKAVAEYFEERVNDPGIGDA